MKSNLSVLALGIIVLGLSGCAEPRKPAPAAKAVPSGGRFDEVGRLALHVGQPCTPQIMFDFHGARSTSPIWLAANARESKVLTDAAHRHRRVHVSGTWRHGRVRDCSYVSVTRVAID